VEEDLTLSVWLLGPAFELSKRHQEVAAAGLGWFRMAAAMDVNLQVFMNLVLVVVIGEGFGQTKAGKKPSKKLLFFFFLHLTKCFKKEEQ